MLNLVALGLKWLSVWVVLLFFGLSFGPAPGKAAVIAAFVAVLSLIGDKLLPFKVQGATRWAMDAGLAALGLYVGQFLWPGAGLAFYTAIFAGAVIGSLEIPLHFLLAKWFRVEKPPEDSDGIPDVRR